MKKLLTAGFLLLTLASHPLWALDKEVFKTHLKKAYSLDPQMEITVGDPTPSQFAEMSSFTVTFGPYSQNVYITKDDRHYFWGNVFDLTVDPDIERMAKLKLKGAHAKGSAKAPVTVVLFSDIQCPNCQKAHSMVEETLFKEFPEGSIRLIYKHFPLSNHDWAEKAAVATECAAQQNEAAFWKMLDILSKNADSIKLDTFDTQVKQFAKDIKIKEAKFKTCLGDPKIMEKIKSDKTEGSEAGVGVTPTFIVNGRMIRGNNHDGVKAVVEEKLKDAKK